MEKYGDFYAVAPNSFGLNKYAINYNPRVETRQCLVSTTVVNHVCKFIRRDKAMPCLYYGGKSRLQIHT